MTSEAKRQRAEYQRKYRQENKERLNEYRRKWNKQNPEKAKAYQARYWEKKAVIDNAE